MQPSQIVLDFSWIHAYEQTLRETPAYGHFLNHFPLRSVVAVITAIPVELDIDPFFWDAVEHTVDARLLADWDLELINMLLENVIEVVYDFINDFLDGYPELYHSLTWKGDLLLLGHIDKYPRREVIWQI